MVSLLVLGAQSEVDCTGGQSEGPPARMECGRSQIMLGQTQALREIINACLCILLTTATIFGTDMKHANRRCCYNFMSTLPKKIVRALQAVPSGQHTWRRLCSSRITATSLVE